MIAIDISKQQARHGNPKAIEQINFTENIDKGRQTFTFESITKHFKNLFWFDIARNLI